MPTGPVRSAARGVRILVSRPGKGAVRRYLESWSDTLQCPMDLRLYWWPPNPFPADSGAGAWLRRALAARASGFSQSPSVLIFGDIERLSSDERALATDLWDVVAASGRVDRLLNHPLRVLGRYDLLRALHCDGVNGFDVYRVDDDVAPRRFPVFLRGENDHAGPTSDLIETPERLREEISFRRRSGRATRGQIVVEYCDTRDGDGLLRKYGAFRVGDRIVPRHLFVTEHWVAKEAAITQEIPPVELRAMELDYIDRNPHADELLSIFDRARIEYGRIDYGFKNGRIQVWEINTNPMLPVADHRRDPDRRAVHELFAERFADAIAALELPPSMSREARMRAARY